MWCLPLCLICIALGVFGSENQIDKAMENAKIVPDVITVGPKKLLQVNYPSGAKAELGNELTPTQVKDQPSVVWDAKPNSFYTLYLADIDISTGVAQPKENEWHQWLVGNIVGGDVNTGETLTAFVGSGPPSKTGLHRYVILMFEQPSKLTFDEPRISNRSIENRDKLSIKKFASKYNLGAPVAGNFYQAQYDDYVSILYRQFGVN